MSGAGISELIWRSRYCRDVAGSGAETGVGDTWRRVATAIAAAESDAGYWRDRFLEALDGFRFLPGGRILAGAGIDREVTLFNCFVSGPLDDSVEGILASLRETAVTMQAGGGIGLDFSPLRPAGSAARRSGTMASGPVSFMHIWDRLCETLLATSSRRGAMMGTLRCDHPDIEAFIAAKRDPRVLRNFNISVLVTDDFVRAVDADADWPLVFPQRGRMSIHKRLPARALWRQLVETALATAEPGVLFIDTVNRENNLYYCETITATNPCGEVPLPAYGTCNLGSINLAECVTAPFTPNASMDHENLGQLTRIAVRFLDDVIDVSRFPLERQAGQASRTRRVGIGVTGLADAFAMLGLRYDSEGACAVAADVMRVIRDSAYDESIALAREKGTFPAFDAARYLASPFVQRLPQALQDGIARHGIRNSHLLSIAPAGTISLLAGNVSSGIEPIFALRSQRSIRDAGLQVHEFTMEDAAYRRWRREAGAQGVLPDAFVTAGDLDTDAHLAMQVSMQPFVDNAISKTITLSHDAGFAAVEALFRRAHAAGIKGCTVFHPGTSRGDVIRPRDDSHCCSLDREGD